MLFNLDADVFQMNPTERYEYLYALLRAIRIDTTDLLNDDKEQQISKFLFTFILADSAAKAFEYVLKLLLICANIP